MTRLEHAMDLVRHDIFMGEQGLYAENLPRLKARLAQLIAERDALFAEWLRGQQAFEKNFWGDSMSGLSEPTGRGRANNTVRAPIWFQPMTADQYVAHDGTIMEDRSDEHRQ